MYVKSWNNDSNKNILAQFRCGWLEKINNYSLGREERNCDLCGQEENSIGIGKKSRKKGMVTKHGLDKGDWVAEKKKEKGSMSEQEAKTLKIIDNCKLYTIVLHKFYFLHIFEIKLRRVRVFMYV